MIDWILKRDDQHRGLVQLRHMACLHREVGLHCCLTASRHILVHQLLCSLFKTFNPDASVWTRPSLAMPFFANARYITINHCSLNEISGDQHNYYTTPNRQVDHGNTPYNAPLFAYPPYAASPRNVDSSSTASSTGAHISKAHTN